jgi:hypothetical protein
MWTSGGAQKLPLADISNLVDSINRKLAEPNKIAAKDVEQRVLSAAKGRDTSHINLNQFLEALSAISAPVPTVSAAAAETASIASAHLALLPGQFGDDLMNKCLATHGRNKLLQLLRAVTVPEALLRDALVPSQSPAALNYVKLVLISAGLTGPSPSEQDARAALQSAGMFAAAQRFTKAAVSSGYNEDLSLPAGAPHARAHDVGVTILCRLGEPRSSFEPAARRSPCVDGLDRAGT